MEHSSCKYVPRKMVILGVKWIVITGQCQVVHDFSFHHPEPNCLFWEHRASRNLEVHEKPYTLTPQSTLVSIQFAASQQFIIMLSPPRTSVVNPSWACFMCRASILIFNMTHLSASYNRVWITSWLPLVEGYFLCICAKWPFWFVLPCTWNTTNKEALDSLNSSRKQLH